MNGDLWVIIVNTGEGSMFSPDYSYHGPFTAAQAKTEIEVFRRTDPNARMEKLIQPHKAEK